MDKIYKDFFGHTYGPEEYAKDNEEWTRYAMDTSPWRDEFKNDAYMAKDRLDAYERGKNPLMMKGIFYELLSAIYYYGFVGIISFFAYGIMSMFIPEIVALIIVLVVVIKHQKNRKW